jgi:MFS family permease
MIENKERNTLVTDSDTNTLALTVVLVSSQMIIIFAYMVLSATLSSINKDANFLNKSTVQLSSMIFFSTLCSMVGKFTLGPPTDWLGGKTTLLGAMLLISLALFGCHHSASPYTFGLCWIFLSFVYSSTNGAISKVVRDNFASSQWATQLGYIAAGSRLGSLTSSLFYGLLLSKINDVTIKIKTDNVGANGESLSSLLWLGQGWKSIYLIASGVILAVTFGNIAICRVFSGSTVDSVNISSTESEDSSKETNSPQIATESDSYLSLIQTVGRRREFWCMLIARSCLMFTGAFVSFVPSFLATGLGMSDSSAASYSALFAVRFIQ